MYVLNFVLQTHREAMSQIEWAMWANEQALTSCAVLLCGSIVGVAGMFNNWQFSVFGIIASLLMLLIEWPRSKRTKGSSMLRHFQRPFTIFVNKLGLVGRNYFVRFVAYLVMCIPCCFSLATLMGAVSMLCTGAIYFLAAIKGEEWIPAELDKKDDIKRATSLHPPKKPPPRPTQRDNTEVDTTNIDMEIMDEAAQTIPQHARPTRAPPRPKTATADVIQGTGR